MKDEDFLYGKPKEEIDEPLDDTVAVEDNLKLHRLDTEEKDKERKEKRYFSAFRLIVGCLVFLGLIFLVDVVCSVAIKGELSEITNSIVEIVKTLLFTLSGYLFARRENGD
ncbi:hypothetical protein NE673_26155 [Blautia producta]|uniref:hypothetical protein n=1 Tax=Blautia producta TaxID=33035 RepID=UPI00210DB113|nr:hypothetical protein [Blautia producta]MCQ5097545.1 hypothetical protein [Blautia producta]